MADDDARVIGSEGRKRAIAAAEAKVAAIDPQVRNLIGYVSGYIDTLSALPPTTVVGDPRVVEARVTTIALV